MEGYDFMMIRYAFRKINTGICHHIMQSRFNSIFTAICLGLVAAQHIIHLRLCRAESKISVKGDVC